MNAIGIGCQDTSHEGRPVKIVSFLRVDFGDSGTGWVPGVPAKREAWGRLSPRPDPDAYVTLAGDTLADEGTREYSAAVLERRARRRYTLRCDLCGLKVDVRSEKLYPVLDRVAGHGVAYIELVHLARMLS